MFRGKIATLLLVVACLTGTLLVLVACEGPFSAERQYVSNLFRHARNTLNTLSTLNDLASDPKLGDDAWEEQVDVQVKRLRSLIAEARAMTVPQRFSGVHASYLDTMTKLEQMADLYDQAMELRNNTYLVRAKELLEQARRGIEDVRKRVERLSEETSE